MTAELPDVEPSKAKRERILLLFAALLIFGAGIGMRNPWPADEPRFALIARDMVETGRWFFPEVGAELYADKPPLFFWMIAAIYALTGSLKLGFLMPSFIGAMVVVAAIYDLGRRWWGHRAGLWAAAALIATVQFALQARAAQIDMTLCMWTTLGVYGLARHLVDGPRWGWYVFGFVAAGAGIITKGVGFLPALALVPWAWGAWKQWSGVTRVRSWKWILGPLAMLAVACLWLVPMLYLVDVAGDAEHLAYRNDILFKQTAERYASSWHHIKPPWYFLVSVIPSLWMPLVLVVPWLLPRWRERLRERDAKVLLLLGWALSIVLFFSVSPGKRGVYILPALPAVALASGPWLRELWNRRGVNRLGFGIALLASIGLWGGLGYVKFLRPDMVAEVNAKYDMAFPWGPLIALAVVAIAFVAIFRVKRGASALVGVIASIWIVLGFWVAPSIDAARSGDRLMIAMESKLARSEEVGMVAWKEQFLLQAELPVTIFGHRRFDDEQELFDGITWAESSAQRRLFVAQAKRDACFANRGSFVGHGHGENWYLVSASEAEAACRGKGNVSVAHVYRRKR
ncbi:MAG: glycosyltransferase family 39 protein [Acidobacteria bacterium]|nr:glycosyltransferase family 39 protein [Acidobacteriota bacterium]